MKWIVLALLATTSLKASSQRLEGTVFEKETKIALDEVTVSNTRTGSVVYTGKSGKYSVPIAPGDTVIFYRSSYLPVKFVVPFAIGNIYRSVNIEHLGYKLKEATIKGNARYLEDSTSMRETFQHSIDYNQPVKLKTYFGFGIAINGLFSALAERLLGQTKRKKKFLSTFASDEEARFVDTRYSIELVKALTGLRGDSAAYFINTNPMPYEFARSATDLELKMWIRDNYRQWADKIKGSTRQSAAMQQ